jgi:hypothetical protein
VFALVWRQGERLMELAGNAADDIAAEARQFLPGGGTIGKLGAVIARVGSVAIALSSRSIRSCTRRMASSLILVSVLPLLTVWPIRNCHRQTPGDAIAIVYSTPL